MMLKSNKNDLQKRGYLEDIDLTKYNTYEKEQIFKLLNSKLAIERTIAIRIISKKHDKNDLDIISILLERLLEEKALYTKLEICNFLEEGDKNTCEMMINYLGKIGNNQHKQVPLQVSKKKSYPLPRDIIARTLGKMSLNNIHILLSVLKDNDLSKISEALDSIGFMIFYNQELSTLDNFNKIRDTTEKYFENDLILWKCVLCLSAFRSDENEKYLNSLKSRITNNTILLEIDRSLKLIGNHAKK